MEKGKRLMEASWWERGCLWGKLHLALICRAMLSKSFIQFSVDGSIVWPLTGKSGSVSHCPPKSNFLGLSVPLPDPQVGKSVVGPRTFLTVRIFLWCNCSSVCGPSTGQPFGGARDDLLQEGLCHTLGDPGLLQSEPLSPWQAAADLYLCRRHSDTHRQAWSVSVPSGHFNLLFIIPFSNRGIIGYAHVWSSINFVFSCSFICHTAKNWLLCVPLDKDIKVGISPQPYVHPGVSTPRTEKTILPHYLVGSALSYVCSFWNVLLCWLFCHWMRSPKSYMGPSSSFLDFSCISIWSLK